MAGIVVDRREDVAARLASGEFFWLDIHEPTDDDFTLLRDVFHFHPLAIEDSEHFGQRAKIEHYDDYDFLVLYGWAPDEDGLVEVHCFYSERFLVSVHRDEAPGGHDLRAVLEREEIARKPIRVLYGLADRLVDSFFPVFAEYDEALDDFEQTGFTRLSDAQLQEVYALKRRLVVMHKAIGPQRDLFGGLAGGLEELPGLSPESERYFRNLYDHLIRLGELIDSYRDLTTSALDVYLSASSNRLNDVTKQLAVIATIFLPLSFITGFFGQNFGWMVDNISSPATFVALGIGAQVATLAVLLGFFRWRGWF